MNRMILESRMWVSCREALSNQPWNSWSEDLDKLSIAFILRDSLKELNTWLQPFISSFLSFKNNCVECSKMAAAVKLNHGHNGDTFAKTFLPPLMSSLGNKQGGMCVRTCIWSPECDGSQEETLICCPPVFRMLFSNYKDLCIMK